MNRLKSAMFAVLVIGSAVALVAQGNPTDKADTSAKTGKTSVTVTGCVAAGTEAGRFILTNAAVVPAATAATTGTSGVASPADAAATTSYALTGSDLKAHLGHKVEVTGTTSQHAAKATTAAPAAPAADASAAVPAAASAPDATLDVKSLKMVAATCS